MDDEKQTLFITLPNASAEELEQLRDLVAQTPLAENFIPIFLGQHVYTMSPAEVINGLYHIYKLADIPLDHISKQLPQSEFDEFRLLMRHFVEYTCKTIDLMANMIQYLHNDLKVIHQKTTNSVLEPEIIHAQDFAWLKHYLEELFKIRPREGHHWGREQDIKHDRKKGKIDDEESVGADSV